MDGHELAVPDSAATQSQAKEIRRKAMDLLARREHGTAELRQKLIAKGYAPTAVDQQLQRLAQENLLSDQRFVESYVNFRSKKGFGPLRIRQELREKGLDSALIDEYLDNDELWRNMAAEVREKRFGAAVPRDYKEVARQMRFLQYRGFHNEQLRELFDTD